MNDINMKKVRKGLIRILILLASILLCIGCSKKQLPIPEYPLDQDVVKSALTEVGVSWIISNENSWGDGRTYYEIHDEEGKAIMFISSVSDENSRVLQLSFFPSGEISTALPEEDWQNTIKLAAILYGGFNNSEQVYEEFKKTSDENLQIDIVPGEFAEDQERIRWNYEINNIDCFIGLRRWHKDTDELTIELVSIVFSNTTITSSSN